MAAVGRKVFAARPANDSSMRRLDKRESLSLGESARPTEITLVRFRFDWNEFNNLQQQWKA